MTKNDPVDLIKKKILESKHIAITSHLRPDGDSICTSLALYFMGKILDKDVAIINKDNTPFPLNNLPHIDKIRIGQIPPYGYDIVILLECANVSRSGQNNLDNYFKINIDHHHSNDFYADIDWVYPDAAAVGCMALTLGERLGIKFTPNIANLLYCAIVSDTGSFQFSNTNAQSLKVCSQLINYGASSIQVSDILFNNNPPEKIKLLGQVLSTLHINKEGNIAILTMFKKDLNDFKIKEIDTEDIMTLARSIKDIQIVFFFKEIKKDTFRISIRSKESVNASLIAEHFGGGGHLHAAGFTVNGKYEELLVKIPETFNNLIKKSKKDKKSKIKH